VRKTSAPCEASSCRGRSFHTPRLSSHSFRYARSRLSLNSQACSSNWQRVFPVQNGKSGVVVQPQIALDRPTFDKDGQALVTPALATADEFESAVNTLQAELNETRVQGRRLFGDVP
jgi:hypothetical protein